MYRVGAHVSVGKGLLAVLDKAHDMGANCLQIFASPPQSFVMSKFSDADCAAFKKRAVDLDISPVFIHATYLINLAGDNERLRKLSIESLIDDLQKAEKLGAVGSIVHTGSHKGKGFAHVETIVVDSIKQVLAKTPASTKLLLEIASGGNGKIGSTFEELATLINKTDNARVGVCLDTAHMFAGGFAFDTPEKVAELAKQIETTVGWDRVWCMHVNDSKVDFGSFRDRHENLGTGKIGETVFKILFSHEKFRSLPLILEVPGFDDKGPDKKNVDILKSVLEKV